MPDLIVSGLTASPTAATTMAGLVTTIRRMLHDHPLTDALTASVATTAATTMTVTDYTIFTKDQIWEFDDGTGSGAEQVRISATPTNTTVSIQRGWNGSTATSHSNGTILLLHPRWPFDEVVEAVNASVDSDLWPEVFDIVEHTFTPSSTTDTYNAISTDCEMYLSIYQHPNSTSEPVYAKSFTKKLYNADTSLWANGKYAIIRGLSSSYTAYINCAHRLTVDTLTAQQQRIVENKACAYLLKWSELPRSAGPTNQGDRTVQPGMQARLASVFDAEYERLRALEASHLRDLYTPRRVFVKHGNFGV